MAEKIIAEYELKTDKFRQQVKGIADDLSQVEKKGKDAGQSTERSFNSASNSVNKFGKSVTEADSPLKSMKSSAIELAGALGVAFGVQQVVSFTKASIDAASNLNETISKTGELFGSTTDQVVEWSKTAGDSFGQSQQQALDAAASFAIFGKSAGLGGQDLVKFSTDFTALASDLASFNNTTPEEAIQAIGAALRGENEPIRRYGVLLDEASLKQAALSQGIIKSTKEALTPQQKVLAAQAEIYRQTTAAQGDFARTSDGLANQQRILAANFEDVKVKLGQELLPTVLDVVGGLNKISPQQFVALIKTIAVAVTTFLAVNGALKLASAATTAYRTVTLALAGAKAVLTGNTTRAAAAQRALGLSFASTPWGFIITAITTAASALFFFGKNSDDAADSQGSLGTEMDEVAKKAEDQAKRVALINSAWAKFSENKGSLSVAELREQIQLINEEIEGAASSPDPLVKQAEVIEQVWEPALGRYVDKVKLSVETQEEANKRQNENIEGLKARKKALEDQLAAIDNSNKADTKTLDILERMNKEVQSLNKSLSISIITGGPISQKDIDRVNELEKKLKELPIILKAVKEGVDGVVEDEAIEIIPPDDSFLNSVKESNNLWLEETSRFLDERRMLEMEDDERRREMMQQYAELEAQYNQQRTDAAFAVADGVLSAFSSIFNALAEDNEEFAKFQKALAIVDVSLKAAQAVAAATASAASGDPYTVAIRIAAAVAAVGAAIGTIVSTVKSSQIPAAPAFAQGTDFVQRGKNKAGVDTIPAYLNEGEAVIPTDKNKAYPGLAKAWIAGNLDDYIVRNFVAPKLIDMERKAEKRMADSFAASLKGDGFDDARLLMATTEGNMYLKTIAKEMKTKQKKRTAW